MYRYGGLHFDFHLFYYLEHSFSLYTNKAHITTFFFIFFVWFGLVYTNQSILRSPRLLAVVAGMKKPNDHAEPTKVER